MKEWYTVKEIAEGLGVTPTRATQLIKRAISKRPGTSLIRKTLNAKGVMRFEMHHTLYQEEERSRLAELSPALKEFYENTPVPPPVKPEAEALKEFYKNNPEPPEAEEDPYPPVGASFTLEDGTIVERWTPERYRVLEQELLALDSMRRTAELHQAELGRLQASYEAHISTYEQQAQYLRERIDKYETFLGDAMKALRERNYIEASNLPKE
jgi:hypothetical protein